MKSLGHTKTSCALCSSQLYWTFWIFLALKTWLMLSHGACMLVSVSDWARNTQKAFQSSCSYLQQELARKEVWGRKIHHVVCTSNSLSFGFASGFSWRLHTSFILTEPISTSAATINFWRQKKCQQPAQGRSLCTQGTVLKVLSANDFPALLLLLTSLLQLPESMSPPRPQ